MSWYMRDAVHADAEGRGVVRVVLLMQEEADDASSAALAGEDSDCDLGVVLADLDDREACAGTVTRNGELGHLVGRG